MPVRPATEAKLTIEPLCNSRPSMLDLIGSCSSITFATALMIYEHKSEGISNLQEDGIVSVSHTKNVPSRLTASTFL
jgi:hypothetical protein